MICDHGDPKNWAIEKVTRPNIGIHAVRVTCKICGRFIGYGVDPAHQTGGKKNGRGAIQKMVEES